MKAIWILMNNKLPSQKGSSDPQIRNPFWKFVVPTVSYFAWLPECLARAFCAESLATSPARQYADPAQCLADLEGYEGPRGEKFGVPAALCGLFFFLIAGCNGSLGYWQSLATRESNKQHQWYCVPKESQAPIHYDLSHHNLCMTERMVHKREKRHNNTRTTKARKHQPTTKTNTHNQTQNHRQHRGET